MEAPAARSERREILPLTGIRGVAAAWVLLFHAGHEGLWRALPVPGASRPLVQAAGLGYLGVDLFFLLSGFVLTWTYADGFQRVAPRAWLRYVGVRFARIYPIHAFVLVVLAAVVAGDLLGAWTSPWRGAQFGLRDLALHVALVHSWGLGSWLSWNQPAWSISAEWFAYLWFPFVCPALLAVRRATLHFAVAAAALLVVALVVPGMGLRATLNVPQEGGLVRVSGEFLAGCCICRAFVLLRGRRAPWGAIAIAASIAVVLLAAAGRADPWALPAFAVLIVSLAASEGPLARLLSTGPALVGGRISYALYMVHWPVLGVLETLCGGEPRTDWNLAARLGWSLAALGGPVAVAWLAWRWIEEPARRAIRHRVERALPPDAARGGA